MITALLLMGASVLAAALFVGWKLDAMTRAMERHNDSIFTQGDTFRRLESELRESRILKAETKKKR